MIEILYFDGCPNLDGLETRIRALVDRLGHDTAIEARRIASDVQAHEEHFLGSPTVRVNGIDVEPDLRLQAMRSDHRVVVAGRRLGVGG